ncbi:MAG: acetyl-transferase [Verrucomicrobia bacterium]|nr:acetyl-transferase [Verrucomicrobiota bacterium]
MKVALAEAPIRDVAELAQIPISFRVERVCEIAAKPGEPSAWVLTEREIASPYLKDYDAIAREGPTQWAKYFDLTNWGYFRAHVDSRLAGGVVIAHRTPGVTMLEERGDLAVIWDIRVAPGLRGLGVGSSLLDAAEHWARSRECTELKIETQNINVAACRLYAKSGCVLQAVNPQAYPELPDEIQLLWSKPLKAS